MLNHIITEAVGEDLSRQRWDRNARTLPLEDIAEVLEVRIASAHTAVTELEGWYVGAAYNLVVCVHITAHTVRARVPDFYLQEVLWWAIDLLEALLARIWHCLHLLRLVAHSLVLLEMVVPGLYLWRKRLDRFEYSFAIECVWSCEYV